MVSLLKSLETASESTLTVAKETFLAGGGSSSVFFEELVRQAFGCSKGNGARETNGQNLVVFV